jgi:methylmalonyl-CoA mutase
MGDKRPEDERQDAQAPSMAADFPAPSPDAWTGLVDRILGEGEGVDALASRTLDGIEIQALYTSDDWSSEDDPSGFPGMAPFTRGHRLTGQVAEGWDVRQRHALPDRSLCNEAILQDLEQGVTSILLSLSGAGRHGVDGDDAAASSLRSSDGVILSSLGDLDEVLGGVDLEAAPIALDAGAAFLPVSAMMIALWQQRGVRPEMVAAAFNADPITALARQGSSLCAMDDMLRQLGDLAAYTTARFPNVSVVGVDSAVYHNAGASEAQELACAAATGVAYLRSLTDAGVPLETAFAQIAFTVAVDADFLMSITKLRAARRLWGRIAEACGDAGMAPSMRLAAITSARMQARRDPWVNMLRGTVATFAASVGGADSVTVLPFTHALGLPDDFARRIARNTQLVLQQESSLNKVIDPAGGAWAFESLTDALSQEAWALFQDTERAGGIVADLESGALAGRIAAAAAARDRSIADRSDPITGSSAFANLQEESVEVLSLDIAALDHATAQALASHRAATDQDALIGPVRDVAPQAGDGCLTEAVVSAALEGATVGSLSAVIGTSPQTQIAALPQRRLAEPFEVLRDACDAFAASNGGSPTVFLAAIGNPAQFTSGVSFARNLFAAGGIDAIVGSGGTDVQAIVEEFRKSGTDTAVLCSEAAVFEEVASELAAALSSAGAKKTFGVGRPEGGLASVEKTIDGFVFDGCDVLAMLTEFLEDTGVLRT